MGSIKLSYRRNNKSEAIRNVFILLLLFSLSVPSVFAETKTSTGDNWGNRRHWDPRGVPTAADDVIINSNMTATTDGVCLSLTINNSQTLTIASTYSITVGTGSITNNGTIELIAGDATTSTSLNIESNFVNNPSGVLTASGDYTEVLFNGSLAQSFTNNGTVTTPLNTLSLDNSIGLTILGSNQIIVNGVGLYTGTITNSNQLTIGTGGSSFSMVQVGPNNASNTRGYFDQAPIFNLGTGGIRLIYNNASANYSTSFEIPSGGTNISYLEIKTLDKTLTLVTSITVTSAYSMGLNLTSGNLSIGSNDLTIEGIIGIGAGTITGGTSSNISFTGSTATSLPAVSGGLGDLTIDNSAGITLLGAVTVNGTLVLASGSLTNQSWLTMADGTTILRSDGSLASSPSFAGTINLTYSGSSPITTGSELPTEIDVLNNLTTNTGGVVQGTSVAVSNNLLTDNFPNLNNWTGDIGNGKNQFKKSNSSNSGGTSPEARYRRGNKKNDYYTSSIYRTINTTGYTSINIGWKHFIDNKDADNYPYTVRVQSAPSTSGPWTDIYSITPTGNANIGPETINYPSWTTNVGGTFYIRYYIEGYTFGLDFWYFDDLIIDAVDEIPSTCTVNGTLDLGNGPITIGSNSLVVNGDITGSNSIVGSTSSDFSVGGTGSSLNLPSITNGLKNFTISRPTGANLGNSLTVNETMFLTDGTLSIGSNTLTLLGAITQSSGTLTGGSSSNIVFAGTGASTALPSVTLNNLTLNRANGIITSGAVEVGGTLTLTSGTLTLGANTFTISGNSPVRTSGDIDASNSSSTLAFTNPSAIILPSSFLSANVNNLTINGTGGLTSKDDFTINGVLNLTSANPSATKGSLDMLDGSTIRILTMGANSTTIGAGDVTGIVARYFFAANTPYTLGNQFTTLTFDDTGTRPSEIKVNISIGSSPSWMAGAIQRQYDFIQSGGSGCRVTISTHYLDSELNGNNEGLLVQFTNGSPGPPLGIFEWGKSNSSTTQNWVSISNIDIAAFPTVFGQLTNTLANTLQTQYIWDGSESTSWLTAGNWSTNIVPGLTANVVIPDATTTTYDPTLPAATEIQTLSIQSGGILNAGGTDVLTINGGNGAWRNQGGSFSTSSLASTVIFTNANATISGTTDFYNISISSGAALTPEENTYIRIKGSLTNSGTLRSSSLTNTIEYNGTNQTVINPNGSIPGYYNLILSGSGSKTMPATAMDIYGDFSLAGTSALTSNAMQSIDVNGDFTVGANDTFTTGSYTHNIEGDLTNSGIFTTTGSTIIFDGSTAQILSGVSIFNNLTVNGAGGVTSINDLSINGTLNLLSANPTSAKGSLDMLDGTTLKTLTMGPSATTLGTGDVSGIIKRTAFVAGTKYTFGHSCTSIEFDGSGTLPSEIELKIVLGNSPSWKSTAINRYYEFIQTGGSDCFGDVEVHYLDSELNGNDEDNLVYWGGLLTDPITVVEWGVSSIDLINNCMVLENVDVYLWLASFGQMEMTLSETEYPDLVWDGSVSTGWMNPNNWTPIGFPDKHKTLTIPDGSTTPNDPSLSVGAEANRIILQSGSILNALDGNSFGIYGSTDAWKNEGGPSAFNFGTGTVFFAGTGATITGETNFYNVTINSGAQLTISESNTVRFAGALVNNGTFDAGSFSNTVEYNGSAQNIIAPNGTTSGYQNLIISNNGTKTLPSTSLNILGDLTISGTVSALTQEQMSIYGNFDLGSSASFTTGAFEHHLGGNFIHDGVLDAAGSLIVFDGTSGQTLSGSSVLTTFNDVLVSNTSSSGLILDKIISVASLEINSPGGVSSNYDFDISGVLDLRSANPTDIRGSLHMGSHTLTMGPLATVIGYGDVTGTVTRNSFAPEITYAFNNELSSIYFENSGTLPTQISVKLTIGSEPGWRSGTVKRIYELAQTGANALDPTAATIKSFYLDSELNGNDKTKLSNFSYRNPPGILLEHGRAGHSEAENWITIVNVNMAFFPSSLGSLSVIIDESEATTYTWNGFTSSSWTTPSNWTPNGSPSFSSSVIIPDAGTTPNDPNLNLFTEAHDLTIESGGVLNSIANAQLELYGGTGTWINNGVFNASTSTVIFTDPQSTMEGETNFHNVLLEEDAVLVLQTGNVMGISGTLVNEGILDANTFKNTVDYNGSDQIVIIPNGSTPGYSNLTLSGSGIKTMPTSPFFVIDDFSLLGTVTATAGESIYGEGDINIGAGTTFNSGSFIHHCSRDFINNGNFNANSGNTILFDGNQAQTISGSSLTSLYNVTIDNSSTGVTVSSNTTVNNILALNSGNLGIDNSILTIAGSSPTRVTGAIDASVSGATIAFTNSSSLTLPASIFTGSVNNLTLNGSGGITISDDANITGSLSLTNGIVTTGANTLTVEVSGSISGGSSTSYINGKLAMTFSTVGSKSFPVGKGGEYRPLALEYTALSGTSVVVAEQFESAMTGTLPANAFLGPTRYWTVSQSGGTDFLFDITLDAVGYSYTNFPAILKKEGTIVALPATDNISYFTSTDLSSFGDFACGESLENPPTTQAKEIIFSSVGANGFTLSWTNGNGIARAVFMKEGSGPITNPDYGTIYSASNDWNAKGSQLGSSGYYCIYNGSGSTVNVSNLAAGTTYWVQVFEYKGSGAATSYLTTTATGNPNSQLTLNDGSTADYRSKSTGNWNLIATWEYNDTGSNWADAIQLPSADNNVLIQSGHEVTLTGALSFNAGKTLTTNGTLITGNYVISGAGSLILASSGTIKIGHASGIAGNITLSGTLNISDGTIDFNGTVGQSMAARTFNNLIISNTNASGVAMNGAVTVINTLTLSSGPLALGSNTLSINGDISIGSGSLSGGLSSNISFGGNGTSTTLPEVNNGLNNLTINRANGIILGGDNEINGTLALTGGALSIGANTLTINGAISQASGTLTGGSSSNINMGGSGASTVLPTVLLNNLTINRSNGISLGGTISIEGNLYLTAGILTTGTNLHMVSTSSINRSEGSLSGAPQGAGIYDVIYTGNSKTIGTELDGAGINYITLNLTSGQVLSLDNSRTFPETVYFTQGTLSIGTNTLTFSGNSPLRTSGYIDASNSGATLEFTNSAAVTLPASLFTGNVNNISISGAGGVISNGDFSLSGILNLQSANPTATKGILDMFDGSADKTLTMGINATTIGTGDVTGNIRRISFLANTAYTFGNEFTTVTLPSGGTLPTEITINASIGASPSWKTEAIQRIYHITRSGGSNLSAILKIHYLDSELNGNTESDLSLWNYYASPEKINDFGKTSNQTTDNWVSFSGVPLSDFIDHYWSLSPAYNGVQISDYKGWRMIASPRATTYSDLLGGFVTQGTTGSTYPLLQPNFLWFDETDAETTNMSWRTISSLSESIKPGRGYYFYVFGDVPDESDYDDVLPKDLTVSGLPTFSSGTFDFLNPNHPVSYTPRSGSQTAPDYIDNSTIDAGWNLLGNPSTQTIDWDHATGWTKTNIDNTIYIWDPSVPEWKTWNGSTGNKGDGLITPFQAFWVKAASNPVLSLTDDIFTTGGTFFKSKDQREYPSAVRVWLETEDMQSSMYISFMNDAVVGPDPWDAYHLEPLNDNWVELYSFSSPYHTEPLVINNLPAPGQDILNLPLFVGGQINDEGLSGKYTLRWELPSDWPEDWIISLQDNEQKKAISMLSNQYFSFDYSAGNSPGSTKSTSLDSFNLPATIVRSVNGTSRLKAEGIQPPPFNIIIQKGKADQNGGYIESEPNLISNYPNPFNTHTTIRFSLPEPEEISLILYDLVGRELMVVENDSYDAGMHELSWQNTNLSSGVYLLQLRTATTIDELKLNIWK